MDINMGCGMSIKKEKLRKEFTMGAYKSLLETSHQRRMKKKGLFVINEAGHSQEFSHVLFADC